VTGLQGTPYILRDIPWSEFRRTERDIMARTSPPYSSEQNGEAMSVIRSERYFWSKISIRNNQLIPGDKKKKKKKKKAGYFRINPLLPEEVPGSATSR
jgi:hypothetical protein